jgi:aminopeptidase N
MDRDLSRIPILLAVFFSVLLIVSLTGCSARRAPNEYTLAIGSPSLKHLKMQVMRGKVYSSAAGEEITLDRLLDRLAALRIVYLAESHTSMAVHRMQADIIRGLYERNPRLKIGMEFFTREHDEILKEWSAGRLSEEELLRRTGWYAGGGGYNFGYYREIMEFARDNRLPVVGLNIPRSIVHKVAMGGLETLSPEEKEIVGDVDLSHGDHRKLIEFYFSGVGEAGPMRMTPERLDKMYAAQSTWDVVMAESVRKAMEGFDGTLVVIAGSGHCSYNLGINRRLAEKLPLPYATVMPVAVKGGKETVVRSLADYLWGTDFDLEPPFYPEVGFGAADRQGKVMVTMVTPDSFARKAGIQSGDQVQSLDGEPVKDVTDLRIRLSTKTWGDKVRIGIKRGDEEKEVSIQFLKPPE